MSSQSFHLQSNSTSILPNVILATPRNRIEIIFCLYLMSFGELLMQYDDLILRNCISSKPIVLNESL